MLPPRNRHRSTNESRTEIQNKANCESPQFTSALLAEPRAQLRHDDHSISGEYELVEGCNAKSNLTDRVARFRFDRILMSTDRPSAPPHASPVRPTARKPLPPRHINASDSRITRTTSSSANGRSVSAYPRNIREPNASRSRSPSTQLSKLLQRLHPHQSSRLSDCELATSWRRQF
ncbi:hypothetical protein M3Y95_00697900 [Aphelenchoides besseyi]|nr:hypothetical protein M3Y95_00697900 [Aphelenchoides besseyi]